MATAARGVGVFVGVPRGAKENGVLAEGPTPGAGWPAVNMGRAHRQKEFAVGARVAMQGGSPILRGGLRGDVAGFRIGGEFVHAPRLQNFMITIYPVSGAKVSSGFTGTGDNFFRPHGTPVPSQNHP